MCESGGIVEPRARRRRSRGLLSGRKRAAALFRVWHGLGHMIRQAEAMGDEELVHLLLVVRLAVEEKAAEVPSAAFEAADTGLPN